MTSFKLLHAVPIDTRFHNTRLMVSELTVLNPADYSFSVFFSGTWCTINFGNCWSRRPHAHQTNTM